MALAGHEVTFGVRDIARSPIGTTGIQLRGPRGDFHVERVMHTDNPALASSADIVLSTVKLYDATSSAEQWRVPIERARAVISLQNGVDGAQRILEGAPNSRVYGGLAFVSGRSDCPGSVEYLSDMSSLTFGGGNAAINDALVQFAACLVGRQNPLQVKLEMVEDIAVSQWSKFLALATNAALTCLVRRGAGVIYHDEDLLRVARKSIDEIFEVARAEGVALKEEHRDRALEMLRSLPATMVASMHHDLVEGRRLELDGLSGLVSRMGRGHGIETQFHDFAYACLKPHQTGVS